MNIFKQLLLTVMIMGAAACGGKDAGDGAKMEASKPASQIKVIRAENAKTASDAADIYAIHMSRIADALEAIESEADAQKAAHIIAEASKEFEILTGKFNDDKKVQLAGAFAMRANDLTQAQMRIGMAMQKIAVENPDYLQTISDAMQEMPSLQ